MEKIDIIVSEQPVADYIAKSSKNRLQNFLDEGIDLVGRPNDYIVGTTKIPGYRNVPGGWIVVNRADLCIYYYDRDDGVQSLSRTAWRLVWK